MTKKIAVANDVSGLGNCSMAANLPVFSVMGLQPCPIPTAVLTNQSCYPVFFNQKTQVNFADYKKAWEENQVTLEGIYSGYFPCAEALAQFTSCFLAKGDVLYINDPVMGDLGQPYSNCDNRMIEAMKDAVSHAFVTTPNLTELCLLTDTPFQQLDDCKEIKHKLAFVEQMAKNLMDSGVKNVIVTGIKDNSAKCKADKIYNVLVCSTHTKICEKDLQKGDFSGTGDIFSSILAGCIFKGKSIEFGEEKATEIIEKAIRFTNKSQEINPNDGICFQPFLTALAEV